MCIRGMASGAVFMGSVQIQAVRIAVRRGMSSAWMMSRSARPIGEAFKTIS